MGILTTTRAVPGMTGAAILCLAVVGCVGEGILTPSSGGSLTPTMTSSQASQAAPKDIFRVVRQVVDPAEERGEPVRLLVAPDELPLPRKVEDEKSISLQLDDLEVRKALEILTREGKFNLLVSPGVTGRVTASLKDVTPNQALEAVLRLANLVARREGKLIYIYTPDELKAGFGSDQFIATRVYHLNYLRSVDLERMVRPFLTPTKGLITVSPTSEMGIKGSVQSGGGTPPPPGGAMAPTEGGAAMGGTGGAGGTGGNLLAGGDIVIVQDQMSVLREIDRIVAELDVPPLQVMIEAVILSVEHDKNQEVGVNIAVMEGNGSVLGVSGNGTTINAAVGFSPLKTLNPDGTVRGTPGRGFAADEPGYKFGFTGGPVTAFVRALTQIGKVDVLARPSLLVLNKQQASLLLGQQLGYSTLSQSLTSTTQQISFLNVGTQLRVRPFISNDGLIRMEVHPERSSGQLVSGIPQTNTTEVTTNVMVPDGATLVIAGLVDEEIDRHQNGMPFLSSLPGIGAFFRERFHTDTRKELVVLLTPRIWNPHGTPPQTPAPICLPGESELMPKIP